jgi:demethylmenaquinone methyltransferase/2-methoxy-6-polyprenyl-1,4-benzoquinol methylase
VAGARHRLAGAARIATVNGTPAPRGAPAAEVRAMFARIAPTYDLLNRLLSARRDRAWRRAAAAALDARAARILDLCAGTGDLAIEIARQRPAAWVVAGDFTFEMLALGIRKGLSRAAAPVACDGLQLPFAAGVFDAVTAAFGVRNFEDLGTGLREMRRVTRQGGQLAVLEFFRNESRWREAPFGFYFEHVLPRVGRLVSRDADAYSYLPRSVGRFVTRTEFSALLERTGWGDVRRREQTLGIATLFLARAR